MSENSNQSKWFKNVDPNSKSTIRLKKIFGFLLIAYIVVFVLINAKSKYDTLDPDIVERIGFSTETNIPIDKVLTIREHAIERYKKYLINSDYESAYAMLTDEYKNYCSYDEYINNIKNIDYNSIEVEDINSKNDYCYVASIVYKQNGEEVHTKYLLYVTKYENNDFYISPDGFLSSYYNQEFSKDDININIEKCNIFTDRVEFKGTIKNVSWFSDIQIKQIDLSYDTSLTTPHSVDLTIKKGEEVPFDIVYDGFEYFVPNNVRIEQDKGNGETSIYRFYFKENEK